MVVKKIWEFAGRPKKVGWYLFGVIPLYVIVWQD